MNPMQEFRLRTERKWFIMKKWMRNLILLLIGLAAAGVYYYVTLPAINIHSTGFWFFIITLLAIVIVAYGIRTASREQVESEIMERFGIRFHTYGLKGNKVWKALVVLLLAVVIVYAVGTLLSSPIINAKKYQALLTIEEREFTEDIKEVDYRTIPLRSEEHTSELQSR